MFTLDHVTRRYGRPASRGGRDAPGGRDVVAVDDVSLEVSAGTTLALIGPSGCGKSTLLRLLLGLVRPTSGRVLFDGEAVTDWQAVRRRVGYVIQDGGLFPHLTARDNVGLAALHAPPSPTRIDELAARVRLDPDLLGRYPLQLSGGQRQRVALMRALLLDPDALLLDEPLGALDPMIRFDLQEDLRDVFSDLNRTVVIVTHDMAEAGFFAENIVLMRDGRIAATGSLAGLAASDDPYVSRFVAAQRATHLA